MFKKLSLAIVTAVGVSVMASSAFAATINTYKWYSGGTPGNGGGQNVGTTEMFTADNGLQVNVSFFSGVSSATGMGGSAANGYWGHGLGVIGGASNSMDRLSNGLGEAIVFDFGVDVVALSALAWENPNASGAADVSVWVDGVLIIDGQNISGNPDNVNLGGITGSIITFMNVDEWPYNNGLRIKRLVVETIDREEVPEPAAIALIGLGLMGMGVANRRRKFS